LPMVSPISLSFFWYSYRSHRHPHSFPTRRSSDLIGGRRYDDTDPYRRRTRLRRCRSADARYLAPAARDAAPLCTHRRSSDDAPRSEEHTSELQSRENLVCRLLLEKKKKTYITTTR